MGDLSRGMAYSDSIPSSGAGVFRQDCAYPGLRGKWLLRNRITLDRGACKDTAGCGQSNSHQGEGQADMHEIYPELLCSPPEESRRSSHAMVGNCLDLYSVLTSACLIIGQARTQNLA
jgi:hypothetical protein